VLKESESNPFILLKNEIRKLKEMLLGCMESIFKQVEEASANEARRAWQFRERLKKEMGELETLFRETEATVH
jgi:hypothetical protein